MSQSQRDIVESVAGDLNDLRERIAPATAMLNAAVGKLLAAVESTDELERLRFKNQRLTDALTAFAQLGGGCSISDTAAYHDLEDDVVLYCNSGKCITAGDVRAARAAIYATREHGPEEKCST